MIGDEKLESLISQHFPKTPLSQILGKLQPVIHNELVQRYLHDFVAMGHYPESKSDEEIQVYRLVDIDDSRFFFQFTSDCSSLHIH